MIALDLISNDIPPLKPTDNGFVALEWMEEFKVSHLPVVNDNKKYLGLISEDDLLNIDIAEMTIGEYINTSKLVLPRHHIYKTQHIFEGIETIVNAELTVLPVIGDNDEFLGTISMFDIIKFFGRATAMEMPGSIITLEMNIRDYSMVEIAKIVESDDAKILASYLTSSIDTTKLEVTIKVNKTDITRILHTFSRYDYTVTASYNESEYYEDLKQRYEAFMRYLNT
ncbi:MAG TPA: CBS domain-containing protein [Flavobacteriales bacterium]|nr:CBS domain-containing protein [Flavobacteriales bacterium]|tara:strand:- start:48893 stop:49570 length:678 start_codon:yes stop_codon:yes gene_type:complete